MWLIHNFSLFWYSQSLLIEKLNPLHSINIYFMHLWASFFDSGFCVHELSYLLVLIIIVNFNHADTCISFCSFQHGGRSRKPSCPGHSYRLFNLLLLFPWQTNYSGTKVNVIISSLFWTKKCMWGNDLRVFYRCKNVFSIVAIHFSSSTTNTASYKPL